MTILIERDGDLCIVRLHGPFQTGANLDYLQASFEQIKALQARKILADLSGVSAMGSRGIGFIVGLYTSMMNTGGRFIMAGLNKRVAEVFELTNLAGVIPSAPTVEAALAEVSR